MLLLGVRGAVPHLLLQTLQSGSREGGLEGGRSPGRGTAVSPRSGNDNLHGEISGIHTDKDRTSLRS